MTIGSGASPRALPVKQQAAKTLDDVETALRAVQAALKATRAPPSTKRAAQTAVQAVMARGRQAQRQCPQDPCDAQDNAAACPMAPRGHREEVANSMTRSVSLMAARANHKERVGAVERTRVFNSDVFEKLDELHSSLAFAPALCRNKTV